MSTDVNKLIELRLKNIEGRLSRISFLHAHLKRFKEDMQQIEDTSEMVTGVSLFYYYSFSQFILETHKLFDDSPNEYYSIAKLLNHLEANLKYIGWYHHKIAYPELTPEQIKSGEPIWSEGNKTVWHEPSQDNKLIEKKKMIFDLKSKIADNKEKLDTIKLARDKIIAHLDKEFQKHKFRIQLEEVEKLLELGLDIFNTLNLNLQGYTLCVDNITSSTFSSLTPITKFYQLKNRLASSKRNHEEAITVSELRKILD